MLGFRPRTRNPKSDVQFSVSNVENQDWKGENSTLELVNVCSLRIRNSLFYAVLCVILSVCYKQIANTLGKTGEKCTGMGRGTQGYGQGEKELHIRGVG